MVERGLSITIIGGMLITLTLAAVIVFVSAFDFGELLALSVSNFGGDRAKEGAAEVAINEAAAAPAPVERPVRYVPPPGSIHYPVVQIPSGLRSLFDPAALDAILAPIEFSTTS